MSHTAIPGYAYGTSAVPHSPLSLEDFERLKQSVLFSDVDSTSLRLSYEELQRSGRGHSRCPTLALDTRST